MAVENYVNVTSYFRFDHNKIDCQTRRLVVSLRKLPETKEDSSINEIDSINSASNIETKPSELCDRDKNLSAKIYRKSSLLDKDRKKSQRRVKSFNKQDIKTDIQSDTEMEDQESASLHKLAMESESNFLQVSDKKTDHESFISKCQKINRERIEDTSHLQVNTSSLSCKPKNNSTISNIKSAKIKGKRSLSSKDQLLGKKMVESSPNLEFGLLTTSKPVEDLKIEKVLPCISINSHLLFSVIVSFQSDGICLKFGPEFETSFESHSVLLSDAVVEQLFIYCNKYSDAFISIVTSSAYGRCLRKYLKLNEKSIPSYSNDSKTKNQLQISFLMHNVVDDISNFMCNIFSATKLNIITHKAALNILAISSSFKNSSPEPTFCKLVYRAVEVTKEDIEYLEDGKKMNDTIIDFYLNYIHAEIIPAEFQAGTHIFSSFFCNFLMRAFSQKQTCKSRSDVEISVNKWIKHVDIFSKDFVFIPINRSEHWYLAVICYLTQLNPNSYDKTNLEDTSVEAKKSSDKNHSRCKQQNKRNKNHPYLIKGEPCIIFFDSLDECTFLKEDKEVVAETLKRFLKMVWISKNPNKPYEWENILCLEAKCPQQNNDVDCGLYLLQYVESFFKDPLPYFGNPMPDLKNWFPQNCITHKRTEIKKVIFKLQTKKPETVQRESCSSSDVVAMS